MVPQGMAIQQVINNLDFLLNSVFICHCNLIVGVLFMCGEILTRIMLVFDLFCWNEYLKETKGQQSILDDATKHDHIEWGRWFYPISPNANTILPTNGASWWHANDSPAYASIASREYKICEGGVLRVKLYPISVFPTDTNSAIINVWFEFQLDFNAKLLYFVNIFRHWLANFAYLLAPERLNWLTNKSSPIPKFKIFKFWQSRFKKKQQKNTNQIQSENYALIFNLQAKPVGRTHIPRNPGISGSQSTGIGDQSGAGKVKKKKPSPSARRRSRLR